MSETNTQNRKSSVENCACDKPGVCAYHRDRCHNCAEKCLPDELTPWCGPGSAMLCPACYDARNWDSNPLETYNYGE